ncbi:hypothetical protein ACQ4PT_052591 [Festuca glaucescens]
MEMGRPELEAGWRWGGPREPLATPAAGHQICGEERAPGHEERGRGTEGGEGLSVGAVEDAFVSVNVDPCHEETQPSFSATSGNSFHQSEEDPNPYPGTPSFIDNQGWRRPEEDYRRESQLRDRTFRERGQAQHGGAWSSREEGPHTKRMATEPRGPQYSKAQAKFQRNRADLGQGNSYQPTQDRVVGGARDSFNRGRDNQRTDGYRVEPGKPSVRQKEENICFWCREEGHHQATCTNPPFCFRCKESGHLAAKCPSAKGIALKMYGFGFPGQGYHSLNLPGGIKKQKSPEHVGLIRMKNGEASEERVEKELKHLIDSKWQWKVRHVADKEYLATFPNKQILDTFSRSNGLQMAMYNITVTIEPTSMDPAASSVLQTGWVQMHNIPDFARNVEAATAIAELAGEVIVVDEVSLI